MSSRPSESAAAENAGMIVEPTNSTPQPWTAGSFRLTDRMSSSSVVHTATSMTQTSAHDRGGRGRSLSRD